MNRVRNVKLVKVDLNRKGKEIIGKEKVKKKNEAFKQMV